MERLSLEKRFVRIQRHLASQCPSLLDRLIREWVVLADRHLPQAFLEIPLSGILGLTFAEMEGVPGVGLRRIEKLLDVLERVGLESANQGDEPAQVEDSGRDDSSPQERWSELQRDLLERMSESGLRHPIAEWVTLEDRHLPQAILEWPLRDVLALSFAQLEGAPGVGSRRIERLLDVLERIRWESISEAESEPEPFDSARPNGEPIPSIELFHAEDVTEAVWRDWRRAIRNRGLEHELLGRFASRLSHLNFRLWLVPIGDYLDKPLWRIRSQPKHTPARVAQLLDVFARIARTIGDGPPDLPLAIRLLTIPVRDMAVWAERVWREEPVPDAQAIREGFLAPLLRLLEIDLGPETTAMIRRRIGEENEAETLEQIAQDVGLTRERVRQLTSKAAQVLRVRWPEGRLILDRIYAHFLSAAAKGPLSLMRSILEVGFESETTRGGSRSDVLAAWARAGALKRTPMNPWAILRWAAEEFPNLPAQVVRRWLEEEGFRQDEPNGESLFFSEDPLDKLLLRLYADPTPATPEEWRDALGGDDRGARLRISRDPRFLEDDLKRVTAAELGPFRRVHGRWFLKLDVLPHAAADRRADAIAMSDLVHLLVGGLVQAGICDATVWGVRRFADLILRTVRGASLPESITPFNLANALIIHSDDLIRPMRRRRLRWESADGSIPIRGKLGWINQIASDSGVPMTLDELDVALKDRFQDYEPYVLQQLHFVEDEEGTKRRGWRFIPGWSGWKSSLTDWRFSEPPRIPGILIPDGWRLDPDQRNVSEGVRQLAAKIAAASAQAPYPKENLAQLPWLVELCEREAAESLLPA